MTSADLVENGVNDEKMILENGRKSNFSSWSKMSKKRQEENGEAERVQIGYQDVTIHK